MRKFLLSLVVGAVFISYLIYQRSQTASSTNQSALNAINDSTNTTSDPTSAGLDTTAGGIAPSSNSNSTKTAANTNTSNANSTKTTSSGQYKNGTYTGKVADAYYGNIQVRATISGGKLTAIEFLQFPNDRQNSIEINDYALPILRSEAIANQSAQVQIVSGATDSSEAFIQSLQSALNQA